MIAEYAAKGIDALGSLRRFKNYWLSEGKGKVDWDRTFENWVDKDISEGKATALREDYAPPSPGEDVGPPPADLKAKLLALKPKAADDLFAELETTAAKEKA